MALPQHALVMETSAQLSLLLEATSGDALEYASDPAAPIAKLVSRHTPSGAAMMDTIHIPDHVFYELTGLTAPCFPAMQQRLATARAEDEKVQAQDYPRVRKVVDLYAAASPRGESHAARGLPKQHIRTLLWLLALHSDTVKLVGHTQDTHQAYLARMKADYAGLSSAHAADNPHYRPCFADALHYAGDTFHADGLWVHAGQLRMMGIIDEDQFNKRINNHETGNSRHQRFYRAKEVIDMVVARANAAGKPVPEAMEQRWRADADAHDTDVGPASQRQLTLGFFQRHPEFLRAALLSRYSKAGLSPLSEADALGDTARVKQAIGASRLLMEHYLKSGLLPQDNASLLAMAKVLHFHVDGLDAGYSRDVIKERLKQQGFYEVSPTVAQLQALTAALQQTGNVLPVQGLLAALAHEPAILRKQFTEACKGSDGLPYEKVFAQALQHGWIDWPQFTQIVVQSGSMQPHGHMNQLQGYRGQISVDRYDSPQAKIRVTVGGFSSRKGECSMHAAALHDRRENGHLVYTLEQLLRKCASDSPKAAPYHRILETMLYPAASQDAPRLRQVAQQVLGEDLLLQVEKDFANRRTRHVSSTQPPFADPFAQLHVESRIIRKNLGEAATLEAACNLLQQDAQAQVWIANHDSDLYPKHGSVEMDNTIVRQHAGLHPELRQLNAQANRHPRLHFVTTGQMLDDVYRLHGTQPPTSYESVKARASIAKHHDGSWRKRAHMVMSQQTAQRS